MKIGQKTWQLQEAKNKFSQVVELAEHTGPQFVTKHGRESVVVLSAKAYRKLLKPRNTLIEFFRDSPLQDLDFGSDRMQEEPRDIEL